MINPDIRRGWTGTRPDRDLEWGESTVWQFDNRKERYTKMGSDSF